MNRSIVDLLTNSVKDRTLFFVDVRCFSKEICVFGRIHVLDMLRSVYSDKNLERVLDSNLEIRGDFVPVKSISKLWKIRWNTLED